MIDELRISALREHGRRLGRPGLSRRVHDLVDRYVAKPSYVAAIHLAGRLRVLSMAASADGYWNEKTTAGMHDEAWDLARVTRPPEDEAGHLTFTALEGLWEVPARLVERLSLIASMIRPARRELDSTDRVELGFVRQQLDAAIEILEPYSSPFTDCERTYLIEHHRALAEHDEIDAIGPGGDPILGQAVAHRKAIKMLEALR